MSNGLRRKRPSKSVAKDSDKLYDTLCRRYGLSFSPKLKNEEYKELALALNDERVDIDAARLILGENAVPAVGRISEIFPLTDVPRKLFNVTMVQLERVGYSINRQEVIVVPDPRMKDTVHFGNVFTSEGCQLNRQDKVMLILHAEKDLPYDMRRWTDTASGLYMRVLHGNNPSHSKDPSRDWNHLMGQKFSSNHNSLVQIRKINSNPSKKQALKIAQEQGEHNIKQDQISKSMAAQVADMEEGTEDFDKLIDLSYIERDNSKGKKYHISLKAKMPSGAWSPPSKAKKLSFIESTETPPIQHQYQVLQPVGAPAIAAPALEIYEEELHIDT